MKKSLKKKKSQGLSQDIERSRETLPESKEKTYRLPKIISKGSKAILHVMTPFEVHNSKIYS
jgi:hypothetical protein